MGKVVFQNSKGHKLVGILDVPKRKTSSIIILAHGFTMDKDENGKFVKAADVFSRAGFAVLRFDFAGSGESERVPFSISSEIDDLKSAIHFVKHRGFENIGVLGFSLGGLCALFAYDLSIKALVLWAPPVKSRVPGRLKKLGAVADFEAKGFTTLLDYKGKKLQVKKEFVDEMEALLIENILSGVNCLTLILHGEQDESLPLEWSREAAHQLPRGKLKAIPDANHHFEGKIDRVIELSLEWFQKYLT